MKTLAHTPGSAKALAALATEARACRVCADVLPGSPNPLFAVSATARLLIIGQAPGRLADQSSTPWNDPSGDMLRSWMGIDRAMFYDSARIAVLPTGLCYPGTNPKGGDYPPRPECAPLWHRRFLALMPAAESILLIGGYAHKAVLDRSARPSVTETVRAYRDYQPRYWPLPHPSWRNTAWRRKHPWFEAEVIPALRAMIVQALSVEV